MTNEYTFTMKDDEGRTISHTFQGITLDDIYVNYVDFLRGCGFRGVEEYFNELDAPGD